MTPDQTPIPAEARLLSAERRASIGTRRALASNADVIPSRQGLLRVALKRQLELAYEEGRRHGLAASRAARAQAKSELLESLRDVCQRTSLEADELIEVLEALTADFRLIGADEMAARQMDHVLDLGTVDLDDRHP